MYFEVEQEVEDPEIILVRRIDRVERREAGESGFRTKERPGPGIIPCSIGRLHRNEIRGRLPLPATRSGTPRAAIPPCRAPPPWGSTRRSAARRTGHLPEVPDPVFSKAAAVCRNAMTFGCNDSAMFRTGDGRILGVSGLSSSSSSPCRIGTCAASSFRISLIRTRANDSSTPGSLGRPGSSRRGPATPPRGRPPGRRASTTVAGRTAGSPASLPPTVSLHPEFDSTHARPSDVLRSPIPLPDECERRASRRSER